MYDKVTVKLELRESSESDEVEFSISVIDSGIGISETDMENIFSAGYRT